MCRPEVENFFSHSNATTSHGDDHPIRHANKRHIVATNHRPNFCRFGSDSILVSSSKPWLGQFLPMCTSHFACAWIYITVAGTTFIKLSTLVILFFYVESVLFIYKCWNLVEFLTFFRTVCFSCLLLVGHPLHLLLLPKQAEVIKLRVYSTQLSKTQKVCKGQSMLRPIF